MTLSAAEQERISSFQRQIGQVATSEAAITVNGQYTGVEAVVKIEAFQGSAQWIGGGRKMGFCQLETSRIELFHIDTVFFDFNQPSGCIVGGSL